MVRQAVRQTYTYYTPGEPTGRVVRDAELQGKGRTWILGEYGHPVYPSPLNVRVGDAGIKVWMVIQWLQLADGNVEELLQHYPDVLTPEDVAAAQWYYTRYQDEIDQRLAEEAEAI